MTAEPPQKLPYNASMLRWARDWRGRSADEAALRASITVERLTAWEDPDDPDYPTVRQARDLAEFYGREFLEFFYDEPPKIKLSGLIPDFRVHRDAVDPHTNREILEIQHWAEAQRLNALELYEDIGEQPVEFPASLFATVDDDVETIAVAARKAMSFTIDQQKRLTSSEERNMPDRIRESMERVGILVLRRNELPDFGVSGLCIVASPLPIIVYGTEAPGRTAFTLIHEFAHVVLRESGISGHDISRKVGSSHEKKIEQWCNRFASAFLIPRSSLEDLRGAPPSQPAAVIDDQTLATLAKVFRVSSHAMLLRLVQTRYVDANYYWSVKLPLFRAQEAAWKKGGRSKYWASRVVSALGNLYSGLVLEAWATNRIPFHQAADYFGLKNPAHLNSIRQEFGGI